MELLTSAFPVTTASSLADKPLGPTCIIEDSSAKISHLVGPSGKSTIGPPGTTQPSSVDQTPHRQVPTHTSVGHNSSSYCPLQTSPVIPNFISKQFTALHARTWRDIFVDKGKQDLASLADSDNPASVVFAKQMCDLVDSKADSGTTVTATTDLPVTFQRVGIHPSFTQAYPDRIALQHVRDYQLPHVPLCPGPYLLDECFASTPTALCNTFHFIPKGGIHLQGSFGQGVPQL